MSKKIICILYYLSGILVFHCVLVYMTSLLYYFLSAWRTAFNNSLGQVYWQLIPSVFHRESLYFYFTFEDLFHCIYNSRLVFFFFFFFNNLSISHYSLLACMISEEKSGVNYPCFYIGKVYFWSDSLRDFIFVFGFLHFDVICLGVVFCFIFYI